MEHNISDAVLLNRLLNNDEAAFSIIFKRYSTLLYAAAYNLFRDKPACEDMVQELFIELWEKKGSLNIRSLKPFLFVCIKNKALMAIRSGKVMISDSILSDLCSKLETDHTIIAKELSEIINQSISRLPKKCQVVFKLSRIEHLSNREIAERLNISIKTVENQMTIALSRLRDSSIDYLLVSILISSLAI